MFQTETKPQAASGKRRFHSTFLMVIFLAIIASCVTVPMIFEQVSVQKIGPVAARNKPSAGVFHGRVDIQAAFTRQRITIFSGDRQLFSKAVTTNHTTGLAEQFEFDSKHPHIRLRVVVGTERKEWHCFVNLEEESYLAIQWIDSRLQVFQSSMSFGYM
ncbi:MAG: hypothetical protein L0338_26775 [Acidobacteria bacterium]|nr:hypothetical protein [Acidobacteriota bacterium]